MAPVGVARGVGYAAFGVGPAEFPLVLLLRTSISYRGRRPTHANGRQSSDTSSDRERLRAGQTNKQTNKIPPARPPPRSPETPPLLP
jgi:hypothetical protein